MTVDHGMDLGTTTCSIATMDGTQPKLIPNRDGAFFTPSAVWVGKRGEIRTGREAKDQYYSGNFGDVEIEFKLRMRPELAGAPKRFASSGLTMTPAQLSAEMIKALRADMQMMTGQDLASLVITVPADFGVEQNMQVEEAARLAGLEFFPLLQEPTAAAMAYGFQSSKTNGYWMVYDLGGGTFDAAIVKVEQDFIDIVQNEGNNNLGGRLVDWDIVDRLFIPHLQAVTSMRDFRRSEGWMTRWGRAFAMLKAAAEKAKIEVSRNQRPFRVLLDEVVQDSSGKSHDLDFELTPEQLKAMYAPYISQSISLCRNALRAKGLEARALEKVILVGGSTLYSGVREAIQEAFGVPLDFTIDPVTVVARGAAIYAGTKKLPRRADKPANNPAEARSHQLQLEYEPVGMTDAPEITGRVTAPDAGSVRGFTVLITERHSQWNSGKLPLTQDGAFAAELHAEESRINEYLVELFDAQGRLTPVEPHEFQYKIGRVATATKLPNNLGIWVEGNAVDRLFEAGTAVPARNSTEHRTVRPLAKGSDDRLEFPFVQGRHDRGDRNQLIGSLVLSGKDIKRDLPVNSVVQFTATLTESLTLKVSAYIPFLEHDLDGVLELRRKSITMAELEKQLAECRRRKSEYQSRAQRSEEASALEQLARIDMEERLERAAEAVEKARADANEIANAEAALLSLMQEFDLVETALSWPDLVAAADREIQDADAIIEPYGDNVDKGHWKLLKQAIDAAKKARDAEALRLKTRDLETLALAVLFKQPGWWVGQLERLGKRIGECTNPDDGRRWFAQGQRAVSANDFDALKAAVRQLWSMMPAEPTDKSGPVAAWGPSTRKGS